MEKLIIFGSPHCTNCIKLKDLLNSKSVVYDYHDVTKPGGYSMLAFYRLASEKTLPIVINASKKKLDVNSIIKELKEMEDIKDK